MAKKSALDQIKELDEQKAALLSEAKEEALARANEAISDLKALGFSYRLATGNSGAGARPRGTLSDGPCPICKFETNPPHDGRKHRFQGDDKKAFTEAKLRELGLEKA